MIKKNRKWLLLGLSIGIALLLWFIKIGKGESFIFELTIVFAVLFVTIFKKIPLNHRFMNTILLVSFLVAGTELLFGVTKDVFLFVTVNLIIYIIYLLVNNRNLVLAVRRQALKSKAAQLVLQNYQKEGRA